MSLKDNMDPRIEELLPFYALDALTDEERELVEAYLSEHPEALAQVQDLQRGASALPYSVSAVDPPRHVKESLMARVNSESSAHKASVASQPSRRAIRYEDIFRVLSFGAAALAIIWALVLNAQVAQLRNDIAALTDQLAAQAQSLDQIITNLPQNNPSNVVTVSLRGTELQPDAHGQLIANPNEQSAVLVITGLSQLEPGRTYQVWLIDGDAPVSAGLLTVDENGQGVLVVTSDETISSFNSLGISIEPQGGSPQPTGEIVVLSEL